MQEDKLETIIANAVRDITKVSVAPAAKSEVRKIVTKACEEYLQKVLEEVTPDYTPPFSADPKHPMKHVHQNEGYNHAVDLFEKNIDELIPELWS
jgi:hypothetical protein